MFWSKEIISVLLFAFAVKLKAENTDNDHLLDDILSSINKIVNFFEDNSENANLDGIFGIHVSQEQFAALLEKISHKCMPQEPTHVLKQRIDALKDLETRLKRISKSAIPRIKKKYKSYFNTVGFVFGKDVWKFLDPSQKINKTLLFPSKKLNGGLLNEKFSDACMSEWDEGTCKLSAPCLHLLTDLYHQNYYITHQYLGLLIGKFHGCERQFDKMAKTIDENLSTAYLIVTFCSNVLTETKRIAQNNYPKAERDLFMEQLGLCGISGFYEFFQPKWIEEIISWQEPSGCYSRENSSNRVKREEVIMRGGCRSHMTTVALLALQQAARHLLEPYLQSNCKNWKA